jgi:hypothetical protein
MAKKEHKPAKSSKQVYAERKVAGICVSCTKYHRTPFGEMGWLQRACATQQGGC